MFDVRVSAGGREVNTTTVMATITVVMMMMVMKFPSSLADASEISRGGGG